MIVRGYDDRLYRYVDGVYRPDGEDFARLMIREALGGQWKAADAEETIKHMMAGPILIKPEQPTDIINVANGLLDWRTGTLSPHREDFYSTLQLPIEWHPDANCPAITKFLGEVLPDDAYDLVIELFGYALYAGNPLNAAVLCLGPGGNGKSVLLSLFETLVGAEHRSAVSLQDFAENRFRLAELYGKLVNSAGDLDARAITRTDAFKMLTGGDTILAERKYGHPFQFTSFALPIFAANEAPISADQSEGWFRRFIILPMVRRMTAAQMDHTLGNRLRSKEEMEGLLVAAVWGLRQLMERGYFDLPASVLAAAATYRSNQDTAIGFLLDEEHVVADANGWVPRSQLYIAYESWCDENGRKPLAKHRFNDRLREYKGGPAERTMAGIRGWKGIQLAMMVPAAGAVYVAEEIDQPDELPLAT